MFDSGRSLSFKYDLSRPPYYLTIPRIVASPTSRSANVFFPSGVLTFDYIVMVGRKGESIVENKKNKFSIN